tara:strand:+ start:3499 stop:3681 length:183 start_codon:yes stop_codon:yes gene_type:complete
VVSSIGIELLAKIGFSGISFKISRTKPQLIETKEIDAKDTYHLHLVSGEILGRTISILPI